MGTLLSPNIYTGESCAQVFTDRWKADRGLRNRVIASYYLDIDEMFKFRGKNVEVQDG